MPVRVEVLIVAARDAAVYYRRVGGDLPRDAHPDLVATGLVGSPVSARPVAVPAGQGGVQRDGPQPDWAPPPLTILHSTSWRFDAGRVVLTYVAVLDGVPDADAVPLVSRELAHSGDPRAPSPPHVAADAVVAHALRHLAWLRDTDEIVAAALASVPDVWMVLDGFEPGLAGGIPAPHEAAARG
ncbi:hypothetical protein ACFFX1_23550 [Dactylosporangium sucinum]|uniref:Uncharacterized protein n=1 Tax=Dactylosporangium sucinum TaxID=1424081 RepID=A0A917UAP3_9ACTN|nr:hypothetical protein [Dactylosporangium sucinum]GGM71145.1 hypothetical protein GCM10007977_086240 [Dactylosporangium sucinum]